MSGLETSLLVQGANSDLDCATDDASDSASTTIVALGNMPMGAVRYATGWDRSFGEFVELPLERTYDSAPSIFHAYDADSIRLSLKDPAVSGQVTGFSRIKVEADGSVSVWDPAPPVEVALVTSVDGASVSQTASVAVYYYFFGI